MQLTERTYTKLATLAAKALVEQSVPLNESVDKLAAEHDMNPEQLARLCEATNNTAFNELFQARAKTGSDDRLVEFPVASPKEVLARRVSCEKRAQEQMKTAAVTPAFDAAWESRPLTVDAPAREKRAHVSDPGDPFRDTPTKPASPRAIEQAIQHLRIEKIAAAQQLLEAADAVAECFRPMYAREKFAEFEKDAMALHGPAAEEVLDHVRATLRMPAVTRDFSKVAGVVVIANTKTSEHRGLSAAIAARGRLNDIFTALSAQGAL